MQALHQSSPAGLDLAAELDEDVVFIEGLLLSTVIGIYDDERDPQPLTLDLHLGLRRRGARLEDDIGATIDYGAVRARLLLLMQDHNVKLLEALAEQIADIALHEFGARWVRLRLAKPRKFHDVSGVGVMLTRFAPDATAPAPATLIHWPARPADAP